jgi:hypothetical protein
MVVTIDCCTGQIIIRAGFLPATSYYWTLRSERTGHTYQRLVTSNGSGEIVILESDLPPGLINQHSGLFEIRIKEGANYLNTIRMLLLGEEHESVFIKCEPFSDPVPLNNTISTDAITSYYYIDNPNNHL